MKFNSQYQFSVSLFIPLLLAFMTLPLSFSPAMAAEFKNISDMNDCRAIKKEKDRLLCYDTVMGGGVFNEEKVKQLKVEEFGSEKMPKKSAVQSESSTSSTAKASSSSPAISSSEDNERMSVTIVRSKKDGFGFYYFQTSDGQIWKQQNAGHWEVSVPFEAELKKGVLGSFFLVNEGGKSTRVKRLK